MISTRKPSSWRIFDEILTPDNPQWLAKYTRQTRDASYFVTHLRLRRPMTPELYAVAADIIEGRLPAKPRSKRSRRLPALSKGFARDEYRRIRAKLAEGDLDYCQAAKALGLELDSKKLRSKREITAAALVIVGALYGVTGSRYNDWMYPPKPKH